MNDYETIVTRNPAARSLFPLADEMWVEPGSKDDWNLLHDLHYKGEKLPIGPHYYKLSLRGETIGVLVTGVPKGMVRERHMVFPAIKPTSADTKMTNTNRFKWLNQNFRTVSRFVVDTMYRGIGAGYRMMNLVSRMEGVQYMEIQSSMSKFNVFGQKAGYKFVKPLNANNFDLGMKFFRKHFVSNPADYEAIVQEIAAAPNRQELIDACRYFYAKNSALENTGAARGRGESRVDRMTERELVKAIQQVALASPMYGIYRVPDKKGTVPLRLPLTAFDCQATNEPLKWKP